MPVPRHNLAFAPVLAWALLAQLDTTRADSVNVTEHHNHDSRDGVYVDSAFTFTAAATLKRLTSFNGTISGNVYAQPLYIEGGPGGAAMVIVVTESNNVYALDAGSGTVIWQRNVGVPVGTASLPCGDINPEGITGTPVVDLASRTLVFDAMTTPDAGATKQHLIYALNVDTGTTNAGWPISADAAVSFMGTNFTSTPQGQRGALALILGTVCVPYGGIFGDCGTYYGWLVSIPLTNTSMLGAWATTSPGGGVWAVGGVASDGGRPFIATGNTIGATTWGGGEAVLRFRAGPVFTNLLDFWAPTNWANLDASDTDIGGSGPVLVDLPGSTPVKLAIALGKDGNAYVLNRTNFGSISSPLAQAHVCNGPIIQAAAVYQTTKGTYVAFRGSSTVCGGNLASLLLTPGNPPTISTAWCATQTGRGSPFVTTTDGTNNTIVWVIGSEGDQRLWGFNGDTGATVYGGGGANELMTGTRRFNTGIAARGRIYIANDNKVYAFAVPTAPILTNATKVAGGSFRFSFTNVPGFGFSVLATTNMALPLTGWSKVGTATEVSPGQFQFTDTQASNIARRFYRVRLP